MKKAILYSCILTLISFTSFGQTLFQTELPPQGDIVPNGSDILETLDYTTINGDLEEVLDQTFDMVAANSTIKGFSAAIQLPDGSIWKRASGLAQEFGGTVPLTTDHMMGMGSISKTFVSATLLLMMEDGLLSLDDTIGQYLSSYPNINPSVNIRQLLSHRSGYNDYLNENPLSIGTWFNNPDSIWTIDGLLNTFVLNPNFAPDAGWSYSNTNYLIAGKLIEVISGQPWYDEVRARIISPMGLSNVHAYPWENPMNIPFAHAFSDIDGNGTIDDLQGNGLELDGLFSMATSAGCLLSTPEDLVRFSTELYGGDFLQASTLSEMVEDQTRVNNGLEYGLGAARFNFGPGIENIGHNGSLIYNSIASYFPDENISLAVQQNDVRTVGNDPNVIDLNIMAISLLQAYQNFDQTTSVNTLESSIDIKVSPNPSNGILNISIPEETLKDKSFLVFNSIGKVCHQDNLQNLSMTTVDLSSLPNGIYYVQIGGFAKKVILAK